MLSDEERKIETLKKYINSQEQKMNDYYKIDEEFYKDEIEQLEFSIKLLSSILNLIEKQQKELKEKNKPQTDCAEPIERTEEMVNMKWVNHNYISKDKIKAKIEELNDLNSPFAQRVIKAKELYLTELVQNILQSLLEKE